MSGFNGDSPLMSNTTEEALNTSDNPSNDAHSATGNSPGLSDQSPRVDEDVSRQLAELKALNQKHSLIISLLQNRFNTPVDISEDASILMKAVRDAWECRGSHRRLDGGSAEGFLLQMLSCGTHSMGIVPTTGISSLAQGSVELIAYQKSVFQTRLPNVTEVLLLWVDEFVDRWPSRRFFWNEPSWRPVIFANGKPIKYASECTWPRNGDFLLNRRSESQYAWAFFAVVPPENNETKAGFDMQEILQHGNDINDSPGTGGFTGENASARHPPIHGIICSLGIRLSQKLLSFEDLAGMFLISSENNFAFSDMSFLRHHSGPWKPLSDLYSSELYQPLENQVLGVEEVWLSLERFVYFMKSFTLTVTGEVGDATSQEDNMAGTSSGSESLTNGLQFEREALSITGTSGRRISLLERRYSTMLAMTPHSHPIGNFRLFSIMDTAESSDWDFYYPIHEFNWKESGINPAGQMTGVAALQVQVFVFIRSWDKDWTETLDELSTVVSVMPKSIENDSELEELMYDPQLKKTKTYFKALQILRIFSDIIEEADIQVESLSHQQIRTQGQQAFRRENLVLNYNWTVVKSIHKEASTNGLSSTSVG